MGPGEVGQRETVLQAETDDGTKKTFLQVC